MRIGIVGGGAIGLTFAASLAAVHDVVVLVRRAEIAARLTRDGIALTNAGETEFVPIRATCDPHALADRDAVVVAVKAQAVRDALAPLRGVLAPHALIACVQNGLDSDAAAREALPGARIVAGSTTQGAIVTGPAQVAPGPPGPTTFARDDRAEPTADALAAAFAAAGLPAQTVDDIRPVLWRKLIVNAAINPLGALARATNGAVATDPDLAPLARTLANEAAAIAAAEGVAVADPWGAVEGAARATTANRNSMLQDLDAGRPTEIDAIGGALLRRAAAHGLDVPLTAAMTALVRARERA